MGLFHFSEEMENIKAILLDVDGTLYRQGPLRRQMIKEMLAHVLRNPIYGWRDIRIIYSFRKERENLRKVSLRDNLALESLQYRLVAEKLGVSDVLVRQIVQEWIYQRPLKYLKACKIPGLDDFLKTCRQLGLRIGIFSDYPAQEKLKALEIAHWIDLVLCATDPEINAFKPSPRGLEVALKRWQLSSKEVLYVGDRPEVDGKCAMALGVPFVLIGKNRKNSPKDIPCFKDYKNLLSRFR